MENVFRLMDESGPVKVVHIWLPHAGLKAVVCVDNTACGQAIGGVRMTPDVTAEEACRLARAMTLRMPPPARDAVVTRGIMMKRRARAGNQNVWSNERLGGNFRAGPVIPTPIQSFSLPYPA